MIAIQRSTPSATKKSTLDHLFLYSIYCEYSFSFSFLESTVTYFFLLQFLDVKYINPKKTKVMIFQKSAKKCTESSFHIVNEIIEIVQNYTYLGTVISSTGNFSMALDKLKEKALHALFSLRKHTNISKLSPLLANIMFDMMISPILTYNSEIWGV